MHAMNSFLKCYSEQLDETMPLVAAYIPREAQTYFRSSLLGGREATTGNTSALRRLPLTGE